MESNDVSYEVFFLRCVFKGERCGLPCLCYSKKPPLAATQALSLRTQAFADFLDTFCDTRESKLPAILRDWHELDAEPRQIWRARRLKFDCAVTLCCSAHKQARWRATARCPGSIKNYAQGP